MLYYFNIIISYNIIHGTYCSGAYYSNIIRGRYVPPTRFQGQRKAGMITMDASSLYDMITYLQYGTNLHIAVLFLDTYGIEKLSLPRKHRLHSSAICNACKANSAGLKECIRFRNQVIDKAMKTKIAFGGLCINGLYEYIHPVIINHEVACIIFIGNILDEENGLKKLRKKLGENASLIHTTEMNFGPQKCEAVGALLESYIRFLIKNYANTASHPSIKNIKNYIASNCEFDLKISHVAKVFHYNEQYLGRLLKKETGMSFNDFVNKERLEHTKVLLENSTDTILSISLQVGYNSVTYFNRLFKQAFGITPSQYRKEHFSGNG